MKVSILSFIYLFLLLSRDTVSKFTNVTPAKKIYVLLYCTEIHAYWGIGIKAEINTPYFLAGIINAHVPSTLK